MTLEDGMLLYHGSYAPIERIDLRKCAGGKDFGKGFYLTDDFEQARGFIKNSMRKAQMLNIISADQNDGFVSVFRYCAINEQIPIYYLDTADKDWLWFVAMNRRGYMAKRFRSALDKKLLDAEIVVGKIANDTTNPTIMAYLDGLYGDVESDKAVNFAIGQLLPERLQKQYCFLTQRAVNCLESVEVIRYER